MRKFLSFLVLFAGIAGSSPSWAIDFSYAGYVDVRLVSSGGEKSWLQGGLGKLRYGAGDSPFQFGAAVGQGTVLFNGELSATAVARIAAGQRNFVDLLEGYVRYRPVSTTRWLWSVKGGAFFPEISLENPEIGWTSYWTITPSAINTWVGAELRTIGGEGKIEWRGDEDTFSLTGAVFGWNDPAGVLMADRGWTLDDRYTGLTEHPREPDATIASFGGTPPGYTPMFEEIDDHAGWYLGATWDNTEWGKLNLFPYDNNANPNAKSDVFAWRTTFWDAGLSENYGPFTFLAQGMTGMTAIQPVLTLTSTTDFDSAFGLIGWEQGQWRVAGRMEYFHTDNFTNFGPGPFGENGTAMTGAVSFLPNDWSRLTAEFIHIASTRAERSLEGIAPSEDENQIQISAKLYF